MLIPEPNFLNMEAPKGYKAGVGRGAVGFTTRADLSLAQNGPSRRGREPASIDDQERFRDAENDQGLLSVSNGGKSQADQEAERIYDFIEMRREKGKRKAANDNEEPQKPVDPQYDRLKSDMALVAESAWLNIPEATDVTRKNKRIRQEEALNRRSYALPDSVLVANMRRQVSDTVIESEELAEEPVNEAPVRDSSFVAGPGSETLEMVLDRLIRPQTAQPSSRFDIEAQERIVDATKLRQTMQKLTEIDPRDPKGWIGLAKAEELLQRPSKARAAIEKGTLSCPRSDEVWSESIRLHNKNEAKMIAAKAVKALPHAIDLWMKAIDLESGRSSKRVVVHRALEQNLENESLWLVASGLEDSTEDRLMVLNAATEQLPHGIGLWKALVSEHDTNLEAALSAVEDGLRLNPESFDLVVLKLKLLHSLGRLDFDSVRDEVMRPDVSHDIVLGAVAEVVRAADLEVANLLAEARGVGIDDMDELQKNGAVDVARSVLNWRVDPSEEDFDRVIALEISLDDASRLSKLLTMAVTRYPHNSKFWTLHLQHSSDVDVTEALKALPDDQEVVLAAAAALRRKSQLGEAIKIQEDYIARHKSSADVYTQLAEDLFKQGRENSDCVLELLKSGLQANPKSAELYIQLARYTVGRSLQAQELFEDALAAVPTSADLAILSVLTVEPPNILRSRYVLASALKNSDDPESVWWHRAVLERDEGKPYQHLVASGLSALPTSGALWALHLALVPRVQRKKEIVRAVETTNASSYVLTAVGLDYWVQGNPKAKGWLERAIAADENNGDAWLWAFKYLSDEAKDEAKALLEKFAARRPAKGMVWRPVHLMALPSSDLGELFKATASRLRLPTS